MRIIGASICLVSAGAGLYLLTATTLRAAPQERWNAPPSWQSGHSRAAKHTWHSGPASTPPETEFIPPAPPPAPPPARPILDSSRVQKKVVAANPRTAPSVHATKSLPPATVKPAPAANEVQPGNTISPDPEAQRIHDEFIRLREDAGARRAFYDDLRLTVERAHAGLQDKDSPEHKAVESLPSPSRVSPTPIAPVHPSYSPEWNKPAETPPAKPTAPRSSLGPRGDSIDSVAYERVVRWARANGAPVPLALAVAWRESHLHTGPPRGAAGEVGMFQIMPERCRLEGYSPQRLDEPEFNAWLGTRLLARYYQEEGSWARAAAKYVAGPRVFDKSYSQDVWTYINSYASSVDNYAGYFSRYLV